MDKNILRLVIRNIISETYKSQIIKEAETDGHALERLEERFLDKNYLEVGYEKEGTVGKYQIIGKYKLPEETKNKILNNFKKVEETKFPLSKSYGIKLDTIFIDPNKIDYYNNFNYEVIKNKNLLFVDDSTKSNGNEIYVIVRQNMIQTIYFAKSYIKQTTEKLNVDNIIKNIDKATFKQNKTKKGNSRKKISLDLPIVTISNKEYYLDEPNNKIIYTKNIKKEQDIDSLKENELEELMNQINQ
jgi:hypothetical protein